MRVRTFWLRLLAGAITVLWVIAAAVVVVGYRPGGPVDGLVGLAALLPIAISLLAVFWPPVARSGAAFAAVTWLGLGAVLLLVPSIGSVLRQVLAQGSQTLLPSPEAVYPWALALLCTALFAGLGVARRVLGGTSMRRQRVLLGGAIAVVATLLGGTVFAAAAIGNELALRDTPARVSRFGPTAADEEPPACTAPGIAVGSSSTVDLGVTGDVDGRPIGTVAVDGVRSGNDARWTANVATDAAIGQYALVRLDGTTWVRAPGEPWTRVVPAGAAATPGGAGVPGAGASPTAGAFGPVTWPTTPGGTAFPPLDRPALDREVLTATLGQAYRTAAEDRGLEFVEGARARHCRIAIDGRTFLAAFPAAGWMSVSEDLHRWRGSLDYWVFLDGQVGKVTAAVNGEAQSLGRSGLQANLAADLTATFRGQPADIEAPSS